jgi:Big-like domain-containing protein
MSKSYPAKQATATATREKSQEDAVSKRLLDNPPVCPAYDDWYDNYRLIAVVDSNNDVAESDESNNSALFAGGAFLVTEPTSGNHVLHVDSGLNAATTSIFKMDDATFRVTQNGQSFDEIIAAVDEIHYRGHSEGDSYTTDPQLDLPFWALVRGPAVQDGSYDVEANSETPLDVSAADGVLSTASDDDGDPLTAFLVYGPSHAASFTLNDDGSFTYLPETNYAGPDSFTFAAWDGAHQSSPATVTIDVTPPDVPFVEHYLDVSFDFSKIADWQVNNSYGTLEPPNAGILGLERYVTVTMTDSHGFEMDGLRVASIDDVSGNTDDVEFLIPDPFTIYTVTVTPQNGLMLGEPDSDTGFMDWYAQMSFTFNSSDTSQYDAQGDIDRNYLVLSNGFNFLDPNDPAYNLPDNYVEPLKQDPDVIADDIGGAGALHMSTPYVVLAGGTLNIDTDANGNPLDENGNPVDDAENPEDEAISPLGVLDGDTITEYPSDYPDEPATILHPDHGWLDGEQVLKVSDYTQPTHGQVVVNANGSFTFKADPSFWGLTYFRIVVSTVSGAIHRSLEATIYMQVSQPPSAHISVVDFLGNISLFQDPYIDPTDPNPTESTNFPFTEYDTSDEYLDRNADGIIQRSLLPNRLPNLETDEHAYPVAYVRSIDAAHPTYVSMDGQLRIRGAVPPSEAGTIEVRATGDLNIPAVSATLFNGGQSVWFAGATADKPLSNRVDFNPKFTLRWEISFDGGNTWSFAGTSTERFYQTLRAPETEDTYETVVWLGSKFGSGVTSEAALVPRIWDNFQTRAVTRLDGTPLQYWGPWQVAHADEDKIVRTDELLAIADGKCGAWTNLFSDVLAAQGILSTIKKVVPRAQLLSGSGLYVAGMSGMWIKNYDFDDTKKLNTQIFDVYEVDGVADANGKAGQNNLDPFSKFFDHALVQYDGMLYDPSYGGGPYYSLAAWEDAALAGVTFAGVYNGVFYDDLFLRHYSGQQDTEFE